jgi:hypothetical protein
MGQTPSRQSSYAAPSRQPSHGQSREVAVRQPSRAPSGYEMTARPSGTMGPPSRPSGSSNGRVVRYAEYHYESYSYEEGERRH